MNISTETQNIISFLQEISENKLRKPSDLAILLEISSNHNGFEELQSLVFTGTSVHYLDSTIRKSSQFSDSMDNLYQELKKSLESFKNLLIGYYEFCDEATKKRFEEVYLENSQGALRNIIDLSHDFSLFKQLQITAKEKKE
jgi:hypothetical protein